MLADLYKQQFSREGLEKAAQEKKAAELLKEIGIEDIDALSDEEAAAASEKLASHVAMQKEAEANMARGDYMAQGFLARMSEEGIDFAKLAENMSKLAAHVDAENGTSDKSDS